MCIIRKSYESLTEVLLLIVRNIYAVIPSYQWLRAEAGVQMLSV